MGLEWLWNVQKLHWPVEAPKRNHLNNTTAFQELHQLNRALRLQQLRLFEEVLHGGLGIAMVLPHRGDTQGSMPRFHVVTSLQLQAGSYTCDSRHTRSTCVQTAEAEGPMGWYGRVWQEVSHTSCMLPTRLAAWQKLDFDWVMSSFLDPLIDQICI